MQNSELNSEPSDDLVVIGRVVKPHGLGGEVIVRLQTDIPDRVYPGQDVRVGTTDTTVQTLREHQGKPLIKFAHVPDRTAAEGLRGLDVLAPPVDVDELDHWLMSELVGAVVLDPDGTQIGEVTGVAEIPAAAEYDLWDIRNNDGTSWQLPGHEDLVDIVQDADGAAVMQLKVPAASLTLEGAPEIRT